MAESRRASRVTLAAVAFVGHIPGLLLWARCRFTRRLYQVNAVAALLTVAAMMGAGLLAPAGEGGQAVLLAWLVGHLLWSTIFAGWILRGGAIESPKPPEAL